MDVFDPHDQAARLAIMSQHPLIKNEYTTITPSIPKVLMTVLDAVMLHKKSLCFNALPQMGKTTACKFCATTLGELDDYLDRFVLIVSIDPAQSESVIKTMTTSLKLPDRGQFRLPNKRQDVINAIDSRLRQIGGNHFVLFLDEIQALKVSDLENLQFIQNSLAIRNISMSTIGFGQTQVEHVITILRSQGRPELIVRFLNEMCVLPSCNDESWIKSVTSTFDNHLIYPEGSKCTYTQFFLPEAYEAGFRLENYSAEIFSELSRVAEKGALPALPTAHILETFRLILIRSREEDGYGYSLSKKRIAAAVDESQLIHYSTYLEKPNAK